MTEDLIPGKRMAYQRIHPVKVKGQHYWLGSFIRERRIAMGITQTSLAKSLGFCEPQALSNIERGLALLSVGRIRKLCELLEMDPVIYIHRATENYREVLVNKLGGRV